MQPGGRSASSRRTVLRGLAAAIAGIGLSPLARVSADAGNVTMTAVTPGLSMLSGAGGNVLVLATPAGKVLVDSGAPAFSRTVLEALDELPGGRVELLFNTHWHLDQVGANEALGGAGAQIIAHEKTRQRLSTGYYIPTEDRYEKPLPMSARPTRTFHTSDSVTIGVRQIECGHLLAAHTDGDIYVAFPDLNVIAVGDVAAPLHDPVLDWFGGGWLGGRVDALAWLLEQGDADTRFVPSYGPVIGRAEVQAEHDIMLELFEIMVEHVRLGESAEDMLAGGVLDGLDRVFEDPYRLLYDAHKGFWAHHNKLTHDIV